MKKISLLFILLLTVFSFVYSQNTIIFKPGAAVGKDAFTYEYPGCTTTNYGSNVQLGANNYQGYESKCYISFESDLSAFVTNNNVVITHATIVLYAYDNYPKGFGQHYNPGGSNDNSCTLRQITSGWTESGPSGITWGYTPIYASTAPVQMLASISSQQTYYIDVTAMVINMISTGNYSGFEFSLNHVNSTNKRLNFTSSDDADANKHPELILEYINLDQQTLCFKEAVSNPVINDDANNYDNTVFQNNPQFLSNRSTTGGNAFITRSFIKFYNLFNSIPKVTGYDIVIDNASLTLYAWNQTSGSGYHITTGNGDKNTSYLQRVTSSWNSGTITWNNKPNTTTTNQATLPPTTSPADNRVGDVTDIVQYIYDNQVNDGFCIRLKTESFVHNRMNFCSPHNGDPNKMPELCITYHYEVTSSPRLAKPDLDAESNDDTKDSYSLYPNPANDYMNIKIVEIYDLTGRNLGMVDFSNNQINLSSYKSGFYLIKITTKSNEIIIKKFLKNNY